MVFTQNDVPPMSVVVLNGVQHVGLIAINLVYPLLLFRLTETPLPQIANFLAIGMLVLGVGTFLQVLRWGPIGSGYMLPTTFTATYLAPSLLAAKLGGLPLVFGMTVFAGVLEAALAPLLHRLRAIFPPEVSGLVIFMIGLSAGAAGLRSLLGPQAVPLLAAEWSVAAITLTTMIAVNVWTTGMARMLCALIGLMAGYAAAALLGLLSAADYAVIVNSPWLGLPDFSGVSYAFDLSLALPFAIASIAVSMKAVGTITLCQRMNDADWVRPEMKSVMRGVMADGLTTSLAGMVGATGTSTATQSAGLAAATGVSSRQIAYAAGALFIILGFLPKLPAILAVMPRAVVAAALMFVVSFVIISGLQMMMSRLLDARRTFVIGLSILAWLMAEMFPALAASMPTFFAPVVGSSLVFATLVALILNLVFRIGVRRTLIVRLEPGQWKLPQIELMLRNQGALWGARVDIINHASWAICQVVEAVAENCWHTGTLIIQADFDEFNLNVSVSYQGELLEFPLQRPTEDEIINSDDGGRRLAGYMLRHVADKTSSEMQDGRPLLKFHFDH